MSKPLLSVLIDTFNHENFIEQAVVSVVEQDFPMADTEILVVDDGSTDKTLEILRKFEPRVRTLRKQNGGQASAFNLAIPQCRGELIAFLDGDDWWRRDKLRTIVPIFESQRDIGGVGHGCLMVDAQGCLKKTVLPQRSRRLDARTPEAATLFSRYACFFGTSKVAYRKSILEQLLPIPEGAIIEADEWLFTLAPWLSDVMVLDQPLFYYRLHGGNMYMLNSSTEKGLVRMHKSLACLVQQFPNKMRALGIPPEIEVPLLANLRLQTERLRLQLIGGSRREVLEVERATNDLLNCKASLGYRIFKQFALLLTLVLPSKLFFRLKNWYSVSGLRRVRKWLGDPPADGHVIERVTNGG
jgi:glycosyltransferase involved in cell wall biosynthesis